MVESPISRRLAVIVHADVAGSTALVQRDEGLAHQRINSAFQHFSTIIREYGGAAHEIRGDALVAGFARASDAVCAALKFHQFNKTRNAEFDDGIVPLVRIGIALGEEVFANDTVTGAGVVLAQRVEQLAEPGGVCVTAAIHEAIPKRLPFVQESLGEQDVKGFDETIRVYRVSLRDGERVPDTELVKHSPRRAPLLVTGSVTLALIVVVAALLWAKPWVTEFEAASAEGMAPSETAKPSIAVLPFSNVSGDPEQEYFADGITDDLITDLSKVSGLTVVSRNSTFLYKTKSVPVKQLSSELGVRFILEGSLRRSGDRVRINAQLTDAATGTAVWAERYDEPLSDVLGLQDKVTRRIISALKVELTAQEQAVAASRETENVQAYDAYLKGFGHLLKNLPRDTVKSLGYFEQALDLDPKYSAAHAALAQAYWEFADNESFNLAVDPPLGASFPPSGFMTYLNAWKHLQQALMRPTSQVHTLSARMLQRQRRFGEAMREAEKAVALGPNDAAAHDALTENLIYTGETDKALSVIEESMHLVPNLPGEKLFLKGMAFYVAGELEPAIAALEEARSHNPNESRYAAIHAAALAELGKLREAELALKRYLSEWTAEADLNWVMFHWPFQHRVVMERFAGSLVNAGLRLPERRYYLATREDRLSTEQINALLSGKTMRGANRGYFGIVDRGFIGIEDNEFVVVRDQTARIVQQGDLSYFRTNGNTRIENDLLCDHWPDFLGEYCVAVYRNPLGTRDAKDEYLFFTLMSTFSFSVFDSET